MHTFAIRSLCFFLVAAALAPAISAGTASDEIFFLEFPQPMLIRAPLPEGPAAPLEVASIGPSRLVALPSGDILLFEYDWILRSTSIHWVLPDGRLEYIRKVPSGGHYGATVVRDAAIDSRGRVFLLRSAYTEPSGFPSIDLMELDPATGNFGRPIRVASGTQTLATAPEGLWSLDGHSLRPLDPESGALGPPVAELDLPVDARILDIDADSAGRLYLLLSSFGPGPRLGVYDPASGTLEDAPPQLLAAAASATSIAIARAAAPPAATYLQNGRFRVEIEYRAYDGAAGRARTAPSRSRDTAIFYFFEEDNWELMVKALDGCAINGHSWVYSSASTDVEYTMAVTDITTGAQKVYTNPLGRIAETVTDNQAFSCSP